MTINFINYYLCENYNYIWFSTIKKDFGTAIIKFAVVVLFKF